MLIYLYIYIYTEIYSLKIIYYILYTNFYNNFKYHIHTDLPIILLNSLTKAYSSCNILLL